MRTLKDLLPALNEYIVFIILTVFAKRNEICIIAIFPFL